MFYLVILLLVLIVVLLCTEQTKRRKATEKFFMVASFAVSGFYLFADGIPFLLTLDWESIVQNKWIQAVGVTVGWVIVVAIGSALFEWFEKKQKEHNDNVRSKGLNDV